MIQVAHSWNAKLYNDKHAFVYDYGKSLIELLAPKSNERILDLGCGSGELTFDISGLAKTVVGLDKSPEMIAKAKYNFPSINFEVGDAANFKVEEKFDAIFSNAALHWVVQYKAAIANMYRALRTGGRIVVEFGGKNNIQTISDALRESLSKRGYEKQAKTTLWYFPSIGEYASKLEAAGFEVVFAQSYDRPTELVDSHTGIVDWIMMFGSSFFDGVNNEDIAEISKEVQDKVKPELYRDGKWYADYKRIRVVARKK
ncbi:methyltransferase domain-containing protein [Zobellia alginiliquefaciens]|uniref:methyltransferase domain-containing protein n=1 Tax=Zobellia alginiliquefaciens TaxID=3032586 RepID=UPI0023E46C85|nr:methyltransferase domain-containing protein [Zobellia alginiliquefaciens]